MVQYPYPTSGKGKNATITIPLKDWQELQDRLKAFEIIESIRKGYREAMQMHEAGVKGQTREAFMRSLREGLDKEDG